MKRYLSLLMVFLVMITACSQGKQSEPVSEPAEVVAEAPAKSTIIVKFFVGKVIKRSGSTETPLKVGETLLENDVVMTDAKASVDLVYNDEGVIRISENSEFAIAALSSSENESTKLDLKNGKVFVSVSKLKKGGLELQTQTMVAAVRGTAFIVDAAAEKSTLQVIKGSVKVNPVKDNKLLSTSEVMTEEGSQITLQSKDTSSYESGAKKLVTEPIKSRDIAKIDAFIKDLTPAAFPELKEEAKVELQREVPGKILEIKNNVSALPAVEPQGETEDEKSVRLQREADEKARLEEELRLKQEREAKESAVSIPSI